jgi:hypothetical protein
MAVIENYGLSTEKYTFLLNKDVNFIRQAYPNPTDTGLPMYYALFGPQYGNPTELTFILAPTPNAAYTVELHYNFYPESIVTAGQTWLGDNFDTALLNMCLMEAITYMKGEQDIVLLYKNRADEAMSLLLGLRLLEQVPGVHDRSAIISAAAKLAEAVDLPEGDAAVSAQPAIDEAISAAVATAINLGADLVITYFAREVAEASKS